jgi:hypothetical protein
VPSRSHTQVPSPRTSCRLGGPYVGISGQWSRAGPPIAAACSLTGSPPA